MEQVEIVEKKYNRFSRVYDLIEWPFEKLFFSKWRRRICGMAAGKILEIGAGTGKNLPYYKANADVTGIDISQKMLEKAKKRNKTLGRHYNLVKMDAEQLMFKNSSFDTVLCTFVLCSVPNPVNVLKEMRRVCKQKGRIMMAEHVRSKKRIIALWQNIHNPLTKWLVGVNINRDTLGNVAEAGLKIELEQNLAMKDVFKLIVCIPNKGRKHREQGARIIPQNK